MKDKIAKYADSMAMFPGSGILLVCVSGGIDSMCLLDVMLDISSKRGFSIHAAHYNHMLRGEESMRDESFVIDYCRSRSVPLYVDRGDVRAQAKENGDGIEETARILRYEFFYEIAHKVGAIRILTAHTADDNTETMIMNLVRGSGAKGLSGIPPVRFVTKYADLKELEVNRPMLCVSRDEITHYAMKFDIPYVEDSTNFIDIYTRNKIRNNVIPILKSINPRLNDSMAITAENSRADEEFLSDMVLDLVHRKVTVPDNRKNLPYAEDDYRMSELLMDDLKPYEENTHMIKVKDLLCIPLALSSRVIRILGGRGISYKHVMAVLELCNSDNPSACLSLPGVSVFREYSFLVFEKKTKVSEIVPFKPITVEPGVEVAIEGIEFNIACKYIAPNDIISDKVHKSFYTFLFKSSEICGNIVVRPRCEGDSIRLLGRNGTKSLKKLFIEHRVPARLRSIVPVIADNVGVLAIYGIGRGDRAIPTSGDPVISISFTR